MIIQDLINSLFELSAGFFLWNNVRVLYRDKKVRGISILSIGVFTIWGYWNLYYYPFLDQWLSFLGGMLVVFANTVWVYLAIRYTREKKKQQKLVKGMVLFAKTTELCVTHGLVCATPALEVKRMKLRQIEKELEELKPKDVEIKNFQKGDIKYGRKHM